MAVVRSGGAPVVVSATAVVSPVGFTAPQTCAALRAGVSRLGEHPFFVPRLPEPPLSEPEPAQAAFVRGPGVAEPLSERLMRLALTPGQELVDRGRLRRADLEAAAVHVCLPTRAGGRQTLASAARWQEEFLSRLGIRPAQAATPREEGSAGVIGAVADAIEQLRADAVRFALIVAVDSYLDAQTMDWLDDLYRLRSERSPDGFIPGEAAAMLLLEREDRARARGITPHARIGGTGTAQESATILSDRYSSGSGLTDAVERATSAWAPPRSGWMIADLNGESYRGQEWGVLQCRIADRLGEPRQLWHPADCIGDVGAAAGGIQIALADHAFWRGNAPADAALVCCASDGGERAACLVETIQGT